MGLTGGACVAAAGDPEAGEEDETTLSGESDVGASSEPSSDATPSGRRPHRREPRPRPENRRATIRRLPPPSQLDLRALCFIDPSWPVRAHERPPAFEGGIGIWQRQNPASEFATIGSYRS